MNNIGISKGMVVKLLCLDKYLLHMPFCMGGLQAEKVCGRIEIWINLTSWSISSNDLEIDVTQRSILHHVIPCFWNLKAVK